LQPASIDFSGRGRSERPQGLGHLGSTVRIGDVQALLTAREPAAEERPEHTQPFGGIAVDLADVRPGARVSDVALVQIRPE